MVHVGISQNPNYWAFYHKFVSRELEKGLSFCWCTGQASLGVSALLPRTFTQSSTPAPPFFSATALPLLMDILQSPFFHCIIWIREFQRSVHICDQCCHPSCSTSYSTLAACLMTFPQDNWIPPTNWEISNEAPQHWDVKCSSLGIKVRMWHFVHNPSLKIICGRTFVPD